LKPLDLMLDQIKKEVNIDEAPDNRREDVSSKGVKLNVLDAHQLFMQGIKKTVSVKSIRNLFSEKDIRMSRVSINNNGGSGTIIFKNVKDAVAWDGKVIKIGNCSIRTCLSKQLGACEENELRMHGITKTVSVDDLHNFFLNEFCVIDDVSIHQSNGRGKITFRRREDAAAWAGKLIVVKEAQIQLKKDDPFWDNSKLRNEVYERNRIRSSEEERKLGGSDREKCRRSRSRKGQNRNRSRSRESKNGLIGMSLDSKYSYRSRPRDINKSYRSKSREIKVRHERAFREKQNRYRNMSRENKTYRVFYRSFLDSLKS